MSPELTLIYTDIQYYLAEANFYGNHHDNEGMASLHLHALSIVRRLRNDFEKQMKCERHIEYCGLHVAEALVREHADFKQKIAILENPLIPKE